MANLGKDDAFPIPWTAVLTVAGIVGVYLTFTSLTTSRPPGGAPATPDAMGFADVEARLWQDPLAAVGKHKRHPAGAAAPDATRPSDLRAPTPQGITRWPRCNTCCGTNWACPWRSRAGRLRRRPGCWYCP